MATTTQTQIVQESQRIEDAKLRLMEEAERLAFGLPNKAGVVPPSLASQLPAYNVAGFSAAQQAALNAAERQGIGSYNPYMDNANAAVRAAYQTTGEAADVLRGADTRNQFFDAQAAMRQAGQAAANTTAGIGQVNEGLSYLDSAARRAAMSDTSGQFGGAREDLRSGLGALSTAQNLAAGSSQANLQPATAAINQGIGGLTQAQQIALGARGADFGSSQSLLAQAAGQLPGTQPQFGQAQQTMEQGLGQGQQAIGMAVEAARQPGFIAQNVALGQAMGAAQQAGPSDFTQSFQGLQGAGGDAAMASLMAQQAASQPGFGQGVNTAYEAAQQARLAAAQPGFNQAQGTIQQGIGQIGGATQGYSPTSAQAFMDPYRQQVIDETMRQMDRQSAIAGQNLSAQAVRAGAFGGEREGVQRAEMQRNLMDQKASTIANLLSQGYSLSLIHI